MALNPAGAERDFSLLSILLGSNQDTALSESIAENSGTKRPFIDYTAHFARKWRFKNEKRARPNAAPGKPLLETWAKQKNGPKEYN